MSHPAVSDAILGDLQRDALDYFLHQANPANGLVRDKTVEGAPASIAAVGFALAAYAVGAERGFVTRAAAAERTRTTLRFFWNSPQGREPDATGYKGFYYHFLDMQTGWRALEGRVQAHHRVLLRALLAHIDFLEGALAALDAEVERALAPFAPQMALLETIPGVGRTAAAILLAELGADLRAFPSAKHLASWAGVCPGNRQRGGRRLSGKTTHGNPWLRGVLGEVAWAAVRARGTSFGARFRRLARRQGKPKALVAVMHNLLTVIYAVVRDGTPYHELGPDYFLPQDPERAARRHVAQLERLGYRVALTPAAAA